MLPLSLTKSEKINFQFIKMSDRHAPINPKIPPEAPTEMYSGRNMALSTVPPIAGRIKRIMAGMNPWLCSTAEPMNQSASMLRK